MSSSAEALFSLNHIDAWIYNNQLEHSFINLAFKGRPRSYPLGLKIRS